MATITHPSPDSGQVVQGEILRPGTPLKVTDLFASAYGDWRRFASILPRAVVPNNGMVCVRQDQ